MTRSNDFFISFGSNAEQFAKDLGTELNPARRALKQMRLDMNDIVTAARATRNAAESAAKAAAAAGIPAAGGGGGAHQPVTTSPGGQAFDPSFFADLKRHMAQNLSDVGEVITKMTAAAKLMEAAAGKATPAQTRANRAEGQLNSPTSQANAGLNFIRGSGVWDTTRAGGRGAPATGGLPSEKNFSPGRFTHGGKPLSWTEIQQFVQATANARGGRAPGGAAGGGVADRVTITGTPSVMIEEAAFSRVVSAIEEGNRETRAGRAATESILAHLRRGGGISRPRAAAPARTADQAEANENQIKHQIAKRQRLAAAKQELERVRTGGQFDQTLFDRAAAGSERMIKVGERTGYQGEDYTRTLENSIRQLSTDLKGVARVSTLRRQLEASQAGDPLADTIAATAPTRQSKRAAARARTEGLSQEETLNLDKLRQADRDIAEIKEMLGGATGDVAEKAKATLARMEAARRDIAAEANAAMKDVGLTQSERKAARRAVAAEERKQGKDTSLGRQQRRDALRDLALGESPESLAKLRRPELERVARTFGQEGYELPFDPSARKFRGESVTNQVLVREIQAARARFDQAGGETLHSLRVSGDVVATEVGPRARRMVAAIENIFERTTEEMIAHGHRLRNAAGGGRTSLGSADVRYSSRDTPRFEPDQGNIIRNAKVAKGLTPRSGEYSTAEGRDVIAAADLTERDYRNRRMDETLSRALARSQTQGAGFRPRDPEIWNEIQGKGPEAEQARTLLRALAKASDAIDKTAQRFFALDDEAKDLTRRINSADSAIQAIERSATQSPEERDAANAMRAERNEMERRRARLMGEAADLNYAPGLSVAQVAAQSPNFRAGVMQRSQERTAQEEAAADRREQARRDYEAESALRGATLQAFAGQRQRTHVTSGRTSVIGADQLTSAFPGFGVNERQGRMYALDPGAVDPELTKQMNAFFRRYIAALEGSMAMMASPEEAAEARQDATRALQNMIDAYQRLGSKLGVPKIAVDPRTGEAVYTGHEYDTARAQGLTTPAGERPLTPERTLDKLAAVLEGAPAPEITDRKGLAAMLGFDPDVLAGSPQLEGGVEAVARQRMRELQGLRTAAGTAATERPVIEAVQEAARALRAAAKENLSRQELETWRLKPDMIAQAMQGTPALAHLQDQARRGLPLDQQIEDVVSGRRSRRLDLAERTVADPGAMAQLGALEEVFEGIDREARQYASTQGELVRQQRAAADAETLANREKRRRPAPVESAAPEEPKAAGGGAAKPPAGGGAAAAAVPTPPGGGGNIFERILKRLEGIHTTLRNGIPVKGALPTTARARVAGTRRASETAGAEAPAPKPRATRAVDDEAAALAAASRRRRTEEAKEQAAAADPINQARNASNLVTIYGQLSSATNRYVSELKALRAAGASAAEIEAKQVQIFAAMNSELNALGNNSRGTRASFKQVMGDVGGGARVNEIGINEIQRSASIRGLMPLADSRRAGSRVGGAMDEGFMSAFSDRMFGNSGFWSRVMNSTGTFIVRNFTAGFVFGLTAALQDVIVQAIETESTFVRVSHALESTGRSSEGLRSSLQDISTDYGVALVDVYNTAAGLTGLFETNQEIAGATRVASQLQMISNGAMNAQEAMGTLASITSAFAGSDTMPEGVEGLNHVADVLTTIQNRLGVNVETSAEGIGRLAGLAARLNLTLEETGVYVSEIAKRTNQTGAAAGEQFSRIVSVMQTGRGQRVLGDALGEDMQSMLQGGDYAGAIRELMLNYNGLTQAQQDSIATTLGGQRQAASLAALLKDGAEALNTVTAAQYSRGAADERAARIAETLNNQLARFQQNLVNLGAALVESGVLNAAGVALKGVNWLLGAVNDLLASLNNLAARNPMIEFLKDVVIGAGAAVLALRLVRASVAGLRTAMAQDTATGAALRGGMGPLTGVPGLTPQQRAEEEARRSGTPPLRSRIAQGATAIAMMPVTPGRAANRAVEATGRGMERLTSGPLQGFGRALETGSRSLHVLSTAQRDAGLGLRARASRVGAYGMGAAGVLAGGIGGSLGARLRGQMQLPYQQRVGSYLQMAGATFGTRAEALGGRRAGASGARALGFGAVQVGATSLSKGMNGLGRALRSTAASAAVAQTSMLGLTAIIGLVIADMLANEAEAAAAHEQYLARFGPDAGKTEGEVAETYVGPATEAAQQHRARDTRGFSELLGSVQEAFNPTNLLRRRSEIGERIGGQLPEDVESQIGEASEPLVDRLHELGRQVADGTVTDVQAIVDAQDAMNQLIADEAAKIDASDLSGRQKETAQSRWESLADLVDGSAENLIRNITGLANAEKLSNERVGAITGLADTLLANPTIGLNQADALAAVMGEIGPAEGSPMARQFDVLGGGGSQVDMLRAAVANADEAVAHATANLLSAQQAGGDDVPERTQFLIQQMTRYEQLVRQLADMQVQAATSLAEYLSGSGDYEGAAAALDQAVSQVQERVAASRNQRARDATSTPFLDPTRIGGPGQGAGVLTGRATVLSSQEEQDAITEARALAERAAEDEAFGLNAADRESMRGNRNSVQVAELQEASARRRLEAMKKREVSDRVIADLEDEVAQAALATRDAQMAVEAAMDAANIAGIQGAEARAAAEGRNARRALDRLRGAGYAEDSVEVQGALATLAQTGISSQDAQQARIQSQYQLRAAGQLNDASRARTEEAGAWQAVADARRRYGVGTAEYNSALAAATSASQAVTNAVESEQAAARDLALALIAPGDMQGRASQTLSNALAAQASAAKFGRGSSQYIQATIAVIDAQRGVDDAAMAMADANATLSLALLERGGHTVEAAEFRLGQARKKLQDALRLSGGRRSPDVVNAEAEVVNQEAATRDTRLQDQLGDIDFQQQMDQITSRGAIGLLTNLLNMKDLTEQQRRDILLKIKGLQDELSSTMEGVFNLPSDIKVPTVYEVRRAMGVDDYLKSMKDATSVTGVMPSASNPAQILREIQGALMANSGASVAGAVQDYSNSNNNVTINGASFEQVVAYLQQYLGAGAQVVRTNAGRKGY